MKFQLANVQSPWFPMNTASMSSFGIPEATDFEPPRRRWRPMRLRINFNVPSIAPRSSQSIRWRSRGGVFSAGVYIQGCRCVPNIYLFRKQAATNGTCTYGSNYWYPGFGGLIQGQIYNHDITCYNFFLIEHCRIISDHCSRYEAVRIKIFNFN